MPVRSRTKERGIPTIHENSTLETSKAQRVKGVIKTVSFDESVKHSNKKKDKEENDKKKEPEKRVHWNRKVEKKRHHRLQDLTEDEKDAVWYTEGDTKIILAMAKVTVKMMMRGEACDDVDYCSRGLEGKTPAGSKRRQKNKLRVRRALLEEQDIQREEGVYDPDYLAEVSIRNSMDNVREAHEVAVRDERIIQAYLNTNDGDGPLMPPTRLKKMQR